MVKIELDKNEKRIKRRQKQQTSKKTKTNLIWQNLEQFICPESPTYSFIFYIILRESITYKYFEF